MVSPIWTFSPGGAVSNFVGEVDEFMLGVLPLFPSEATAGCFASTA